MLSNIKIKNYALIDNLDIDFHSGFSVITGQTGAGKSIILGALALLLGQRADAKAIKGEATKCVVEATFQVASLNLGQFFEENDIDFDNQECLLRREVYATGKSRAFINDIPVQLSKLKEIGGKLIDIHSQHQNLLLEHEDFLITMLDAMSDDKSVKRCYLDAFAHYSECKKEYERLTSEAEKNRDDADYLRFQLQQIESGNLNEGEQEELEKESEKLEHAEEIKAALFEASNSLSADDGAASKIRTATGCIGEIAGVLEEAAPLAERLESARIEIEDIAEELETLLDKTDYDPERMQLVSDRLSYIYDLEKKHHAQSIAELLNLAADMHKRLDMIDNIDDYLEKSKANLDASHKAMAEAGQKLTCCRQKAAEEVKDSLVKSLATMGMPNLTIRFDFTPKATPDSRGTDSVAFMFSANKNVPVQDVARIASGGEIARLMLALKSLMSRKQNLPTVIFDEIDTGVSGTMAEKMALEMQRMAQNCQVICITHLPQIAAIGQQHYRVSKTDDAHGTTSHIDLLDSEQRVEEIAQMLSGENLTKAAIDNARALLKR